MTCLLLRLLRPFLVVAHDWAVRRTSVPPGGQPAAAHFHRVES